MQIEYAFETAALPELVILTNGKPNPGDELVNSPAGTVGASFVVERLIGSRIEVKIPGGTQTMHLACTCMTQSQWVSRFA